MSDTDDRPGLAERYGSATQSSHLKMQETRCDVDYLIAAGWLRDGLGAQLYRLRTEYDTVRLDMRKAEASLPTWQLRIDAAEKAARSWHAAWHAPMLYRAALAEEPDRLRLEARNYVLTERVLALINLKTLVPARQALWALAASGVPPVGKFPLSIETAAVVTGRVLDAWLDPICAPCEGRGFNGGHYKGEQKVRCRSCAGSGERRTSLGATVEEKRFARHLLDAIAENLVEVERAMRGSLRQHGTEGA
jgi:hypothetical protein